MKWLSQASCVVQSQETHRKSFGTSEGWWDWTGVALARGAVGSWRHSWATDVLWGSLSWPARLVAADSWKEMENSSLTWPLGFSWLWLIINLNCFQCTAAHGYRWAGGTTCGLLYWGTRRVTKQTRFIHLNKKINWSDICPCKTYHHDAKVLLVVARMLLCSC